MAKELLKEAIADAKAVREVALQNAKMALEEAFDSKIKSMLSAKLAEEIEEDVELEEEYIEEEAEITDEAVEATDEGMSYDEDDKDAANEEFDLEEDLDEEINLDELMAELEEMSYDEDEDGMKEATGEDDDKVEEGKDEDEVKEGLGKLAGTIKGVGKAFSLFDNPEDTAKDLRATLEKNPELKDDENFMAMLKTVEKFAAGGAAAGAATAAYRSKGAANEEFDIDALVAEIESELEEGKKVKDEEEMKEAKKKDDEEKEKMKEELEEALSTVSTLQETISEMNLLNSKLLYCNKLFRANALTEAQKVKVVDALDKASTTGEAKLVFETLQESFAFTGVEKKAIQEGLGRASKAAGTAPKKVITESVDETVSRFQKLANIKF
jgi:hypothetical protein